MHTKVFNNLEENKKELIFSVCLEEFAGHGYKNASTNRMVKKLGISKGSLFKYFKTKEEIYFFVLDVVVNEVRERLSENIADMPKQLTARIKKHAEMELDIFIKKPHVYKLFKSTFGKEDEQIRKKIAEKYPEQNQEIFYSLFDGIDTTNLLWDVTDTINTVKFIIEGLNNQFLAQMEQFDSVYEFKKKYLETLDTCLKIIETGIYIK